MNKKTIKLVFKFLLISFVLITICISSLFADTTKTETPIFPKSWGMWEKTLPNPLHKETIQESKKELYRYILNHLELDKDDRVLEIGYNEGIGAKFLEKTYPKQSYIGIDLSKEQINPTFADKRNTCFQVVQKGSIPYAQGSFSKIFSINFRNIFPSAEKFVHSSSKALRQNGKLVFSGIFLRSNTFRILSQNEFSTQMVSHLDKVEPIDNIQSFLQKEGFVDIHIEPIGKYIFHPDIPIEKKGYIISPENLWKKSYEEGLIDYYVISAYKAVELL